MLPAIIARVCRTLSAYLNVTCAHSMLFYMFVRVTFLCFRFQKYIFVKHILIMCYYFYVSWLHYLSKLPRSLS